MFNPTDFPKPTLISVNGVELEVFEAGRQNAGKPIVPILVFGLGFPLPPT